MFTLTNAFRILKINQYGYVKINGKIYTAKELRDKVDFSKMEVVKIDPWFNMGYFEGYDLTVKFHNCIDINKNM